MITPTAPSDDGALLQELEHFAVEEGMNETPWPGLAIFRASNPEARVPVVYEPVICVVASGRKRVYLNDEIYNYDPLHYLVVGVPLPAEAEIVEASNEQPFLSLRLDVDVAVLSELLLETEPAADDARRAIYASPMKAELSGSVVRLLRSLRDPADARILAPLAVRELLYYVLKDAQGEKLRSVAMRDSRANRISAVLSYMQTHYANTMTIDGLAERACMSSSTFHHNFKSVTSMSPLQYLKALRLHRARLMILHEGASASAAASAVGYNSPSQFSREFKRTFGAPPVAERNHLRNKAVASRA